MMRLTKLTLLALVAGGLLVAAPLAAQRGPEGRRGMAPQDREQLEQRIRAQMGRMMRERLGLTDEQGEALAEVVQRFEGQRRQLFREEQATRRRVEALLLEGGSDEAEAEELLARMVELRAQEATLFAQERAVLLEILSATQVLQLQALRDEIGERIRSLRRSRGGQPEGRRRGGGGDDGSDDAQRPRR